MKKTYNNPMLSVVSINKSDVITTSLNVANEYNSTWTTLDAGRRFDEWDAGY